MLYSNQINKPKILMIAPEPFFECRGTPISVYQRIRALSNLGYKIDLLTYFLGKDVYLPGLRIIRTPRIPFIKYIPIGPSWRKAFLDIFLFLKALLLLINGSYQVIHSHEEASYISSILASMFHIRHVYDMHSSLPSQIMQSRFGWISPMVNFFRYLEKLTIIKADAVITIGTDLEEHIRKIKPIVKSIVIENLPLQYFVPEDQEAVKLIKEKLKLNGRPSIVYSGSFEVYQGIDLLISSAKIVKATFPKALFILIGGNPAQVERYKNKIQHEHLEENFVLAGTVSEVDSIAYLSLARVLISPRVSGMSIPLKIYTYLSSGKAIVATNIEAHTKVLTNEYAILTNPTAEGIAEGVIKILQDPELGNILGSRGKLIAIEKYNIKNYLERIEEIYQALFPTNIPSSIPENVIVKG